MANTGNVFVGTGESVARGTNTDWTNPGNIVSDNATDATCVGGASGSDYLVGRNAALTAIPDGSTINGVTVRVEASEHSSGTEVLTAQLQDDGAALVGNTKTATVSGTAKAVYTYGGTADVWGATLTAAIVKDPDFGVRCWFTTAHDVRVDYVTLAIEYTPPISTGDLSKALPLTLATAGTALLQAVLSRALPLALVAAGVVALEGASAKPLPLALAATGTVATPSSTGTLEQALPLTLSTDGDVAVVGVCTKPLFLALSAQGTVPLGGGVGLVLPLSLSADAELPLVGALARALGFSLTAIGSGPEAAGPSYPGRFLRLGRRRKA